MKKEEKRNIVRQGYAKIAIDGTSCCGSDNSCCGTSSSAGEISKKIGYSDEEIGSVPEGANLGLGCGNPVAIASLKEGETVLDLGSGGGFDCFLAAEKVGDRGHVIGVDMTPEMIERARKNADKGNYRNIEFRLGEIEHLPVADGSVDAVISNCVINLSPDKQAVFQETFRSLKPGGRIMVSDIVLTKDLPDFLRDSDTAYVGCISGAVRKEEYLSAIEGAGFSAIEIVDEQEIPVDSWVTDPIADSVVKKLNISREQIRDVLGAVVSVKVKGIKT